MGFKLAFKGLNAKLNPICHLPASLEAHHILHVSRIRVNLSAVLTCTFDQAGWENVTHGEDEN